MITLAGQPRVWTSSLTLWPPRRLPGPLISHSSQRGQRARARWEGGAARGGAAAAGKEKQEGYFINLLLRS